MTRSVLHALLHSLNLLLQRLLEWAVMAVVGVLFAGVLWGVVARFLLPFPSQWTEELARLLLIWVTFLGAAVAFARQRHLGLDYFARQLHPHARRLLDITVQGVVIAFVAAVFVHGGVVLVSETLAAGQLTPALQVRMGWFYLVVPVSGVAIVCFAVERMVQVAEPGRHDEPAESERTD